MSDIIDLSYEGGIHMNKKKKIALTLLFIAPFLIGCNGSKLTEVKFGSYSDASFEMGTCYYDSDRERYEVSGTITNSGTGYVVPDVCWVEYQMGIMPGFNEPNSEIEPKLFFDDLIGPGENRSVKFKTNEQWPSSTKERFLFRGFEYVSSGSEITFNSDVSFIGQDDGGLLSNGYYVYEITYENNLSYSDMTFFIFDIEYEGITHHIPFKEGGKRFSTYSYVDPESLNVKKVTIASYESKNEVNMWREIIKGSFLYSLVIGLIANVALAAIIVPAIVIPTTIRRKRRAAQNNNK